MQRLETRQFIYLAIGCAVILRLLLMPFFAHVDLFSEYRRVHYVIDNGLYLAHTTRIFTFYVEVLFSYLSHPFAPSSNISFYLPDPSNSTASVPDYFLFLQDPNVFRYLFLFKLPYLCFDLGIAAVLWRFIDDIKIRRVALLLWLFNPITIYATYIFGRFEVIGIFFIALTALQLKNGRIFLGATCFAFALLSREIYLLLTPFFLIACLDFKDHWLKNLLVLLTLTIIVAGLYQAPITLIQTFGNADPFFNPDADHNPFNKLFSLEIHWFYPVVFGLGACAVYAWEIAKSHSHDERFVIVCALALFVYFAINDHSIHYSAWLVVFPLLALHYGKKLFFPFLIFCGCWFILSLFKTDNGVFTLFLAAPLSMEFAYTGVFPVWLMQNVESGGVVITRGIESLRTLYALTMAYFAYKMVCK